MFTSDHLDQISVAGSGNSEESMIPVVRISIIAPNAVHMKQYTDRL